jgi:hypothetical protein
VAGAAVFDEEHEAADAMAVVTKDSDATSPVTPSGER